jgi:hypothetical protein
MTMAKWLEYDRKRDNKGEDGNQVVILFWAAVGAENRRSSALKPKNRFSTPAVSSEFLGFITMWIYAVRSG